jgi:hypothetical protein
MLSVAVFRLIDEFEAAHQDVKRAYLAWCPTQAELGIDKSTVTKIVSSLDELGLISQLSQGDTGPLVGRKPIFLRWKTLPSSVRLYSFVIALLTRAKDSTRINLTI